MDHILFPVADFMICLITENRQIWSTPSTLFFYNVIPFSCLLLTQAFIKIESFFNT